MVTGNGLTLGQRFRIHRKNRGISQDDLALGICSRQTISLLERDSHVPAVEIMEKLADRLRVPLQEFMGEHASALEIKVQVDIVRVYVEAEDYAPALDLIEKLWSNEGLLAFQRRELLLCKAECLIKTERAETALALLEDMQRELEQTRESDDHLMARLYDKLGTAYYYLSNMATAYAHYLHAYQLSMWFPEFDLTAARVTYNLGKACRMLDRPGEAIEYLMKAEKFFSRAADAKRLALTMFELGIAYTERRQFERANACLQESMSLYQSLNIMSMARRVKESHAFVVLAKQDPAKAIEELLSCASEYEKENNTIQLVYTYAKVVRVLLQMKNLAGAEHYLEKAMQLIPASEAKQQPEHAFAYQVNALYLLAVGDYKRSVEVSVLSSVLFERIGLMKDAAESLALAAEANRKQGKYQQADQLSQKTIELLHRAFECSINQIGVI